MPWSFGFIRSGVGLRIRISPMLPRDADADAAGPGMQGEDRSRAMGKSYSPRSLLNTKKGVLTMTVARHSLQTLNTIAP